MRDLAFLARPERWWDHKVPPLVAVAAIVVGGRQPSGADVMHLLLLLVSVAGVAAFGHLVNDWADVEADARGGKPNRLTNISNAGRGKVVVASLMVGLLPWFLLPRRPSAWLALGIEIALLMAYSVPPLRLKTRDWMGALADAGYAYAVPFVLVVLVFREEGAGLMVPLLLGGWGLLIGLRGILWHQVLDAEADAAAGTNTVATRFGLVRTEAIVSFVFLPLEFVGAGALVVVSDARWLPWLLAAFGLYRTFQVVFLWEPRMDWGALRSPSELGRFVGVDYMNYFLERWLPIGALFALAAAEGGLWWVALAVHLLFFRNAIRTLIGDDLWVLPDALTRLRFSRRVRRDVRRVAERRGRVASAGPAPLADPTAQRFVFVVCGPASHVRTLRMALAHLRPLTRAEIWVVTDSRRNEVPIEISGVNRVVDVCTPAHLDDHQASIWLKTSVHRHVPSGEWCYLDSDIIAVAPGVERVFEARRGPVAFASDVTIIENSVDRFSPWAMTCPCAGHGDEHSCVHLRVEIRRRFGLAVPGDWLHWNGGVFVFGHDSETFLDLWHERTVASFEWPEWRTRDQGTLIATAWTLGLQDLPRIPPDFNFIADLGNFDLCLDPSRGWAHHPAGPWSWVVLMHLYTSALDDPDWDLSRDLEAVVLQRSRVRLYRWQRSQVVAWAKRLADRTGNAVLRLGRAGVRRVWWRIVALGWTVRLACRASVRRARAAGRFVFRRQAGSPESRPAAGDVEVNTFERAVEEISN